MSMTTAPVSDLLPTRKLLSRKGAAEELTKRGYPISDKTLATMASRGGGPVFRDFGSRVLYQWEDLLSWAEGRLSKPISSSSERDIPRAAKRLKKAASRTEAAAAVTSH